MPENPKCTWRPRHLVAAVTGLLVCSPSLAAARAQTMVTLSLDPCLAVDVAATRALLALELGVPVNDGAGSGAPALHVAADCARPAPELAARLAVDDGITGKRIERAVPLAPFAPAARPRVLALAAAELVALSWLELDQAPATPRPPAPAAAVAAARKVAVARRGRGEILVAVAVQSGSRTATAAGLVLGAGRRWRALGITGEVEGTTGARSTSLGRVLVQSASAALAFTASAERGPWRVDGAAGGRLGLATLSGQPLAGSGARAGTVRGPWGGPLVGARVGLALSPRFAVVATGEAGLFTLSVGALVAGRRDVALDRVWVRAGLGVGVRF